MLPMIAALVVIHPAMEAAAQERPNPGLRPAGEYVTPSPKGQLEVVAKEQSLGQSILLIRNPETGEMAPILEVNRSFRPAITWHTESYIEIRMPKGEGTYQSIFYDLRGDRLSAPVPEVLAFDPARGLAAAQDGQLRLVNVFALDDSGTYARFNAIELGPMLPKTQQVPPPVRNAAFDRDGNFGFEVEARPGVWIKLNVENRYIDF